MAAVSPPKPWERAKSTSLGSSANTYTPITKMSATTTGTSISSSEPPSLPERPSSLSTVVNRNASNYSPYNNARFGASTFGTSPYSTYGNYNNYSFPNSRFGTYGNSMYGGYGNGYGSMYGGLGGGMYGGGMMGQPGMMGPDPNDPNSLTNTFSQSTQATFQMIESLVGAFGGVAQMLESTYMATHSSFFAMISVAEQFSNLRTTLGSILGIFTLARYLRTLVAKLTGRPPPADATSLTPSAFASFQGLSSSSKRTLPNGQPAPSRKPFLIFLAAVLGLPYLMAKLIRTLASSQQHQQQQQQQSGQQPGLDGHQHQHIQPNPGPFDPNSLIFCRALYDYPPPSSLASSSQPFSPPNMDLSIKKGDLVAVLTKSDPAGNPSEWWQCRSRDGRIGYLPGLYLEEIKRKPLSSIDGDGSNAIGKLSKQIEEGSSSRVNTLTSILNGGSPTKPTSTTTAAATNKSDSLHSHDHREEIMANVDVKRKS